MNQAVELPDKVWCALQEAAKASGLTPADWIAAHLPGSADANGVGPQLVEENTEELEPPTYVSVPGKPIGAIQVEFVAGRKAAPLPYPLDEADE